MSLIPYIFDHLRPRSHDLFGMELCPKDLWMEPIERTFLRPFSVPFGYLGSQLAHFDELQKQMYIGKDGFDVKINVEQFKPEEITVKTVDNSIVVEAKHEKKNESGLISRQITRRIELPQGFKSEQVVSNLSSDGVLTIKCPKSEAIEGAKVREIQIEHTGPIKSIDEKAKDNQKVGTVEENSKEKN